MSLYFDFVFACDLRTDTPAWVIDLLGYMTRKEEREFQPPPGIPLFEGEMWRDFLQCSGAHIAVDYSSLQQVQRYEKGGPVTKHLLSWRCYMIDDVFYYAFGFLEWLAPFSDTLGFVGYYREERGLFPWLIYFRDGKVYLSEVKQIPLEMRTSAPW